VPNTFTTESTLNNQINTYFSKTALEMLTPKCLIYQFGEKTPLPKGLGTSVRWNGWSALGTVTGALAEGGPGVAGASLSSRKISAVVKQYGKFVAVSDYVEYAAVFGEVESMMEVITDCARRSVELVCQQGMLKGGALTRLTVATALSGWSAATKSAYHSGSQKSCAAGNVWRFPVRWGSSAAKLSLFQKASTSACIGQVAITSCVRSLRNKNAMEFADGNFVMFCNTDTASDMINDPDFKGWYQNVDNTPVKAGLSQGMAKPAFKAFGVTAYATNMMPKSTDADAKGNISLIFGRGAYGVTEFNTNGKAGFNIIIKRPGPSSTDNPLDLFSTIGFKFQLAAAALNTSAGRILITLDRGQAS
jgi:N4-gp56 family major capsid protein